MFTILKKSKKKHSLFSILKKKLQSRKWKKSYQTLDLSLFNRKGRWYKWRCLTNKDLLWGMLPLQMCVWTIWKKIKMRIKNKKVLTSKGKEKNFIKAFLSLFLPQLYLDFACGLSTDLYFINLKNYNFNIGSKIIKAKLQ
jgi:hypothetical protein